MRIPLVPTLVVAAGIAVMIALGLWQLTVRLPQKEAQLAQLAANPARPPLALPVPADPALLFRRAGGYCTAPTPPRVAGAGAEGYRLIAECAGGMLVQLGTTRDPRAAVQWRGGTVRGYLTQAPDGRSMLQSLFDPAPPRLMLVADTPPPGLAANTPPDLAGVPNNHLAYAVQWFFFAAVAAVIYALALRRRAAAQSSAAAG